MAEITFARPGSPKDMPQQPAVMVHPSFRIADHVIRESGRWILYTEGERVRCFLCKQSVIAGSFRTDDLSTALLAHLMQKHGWTRETVPHDDAN
jgi:hypothetical protein